MPKSFASELRGEWSELSRSDSACWQQLTFGSKENKWQTQTTDT
jgi:hypothetical protein